MNSATDDRAAERRFMTIVTTAFVLSLAIGSAVILFLMTRLTVAPSDVLAEVKLLEDKLDQQASEAHLVMEVLEASGSAVVGMDGDGHVVLWSDGAEEFFGTPRSQVIGYGIAFMIPDGMRDKHREAFDAVMLSKRTDPVQNTVECTARHADGSEIPVRINVWGVPGRMALAVFNRHEPSEG